MDEQAVVGPRQGEPLHPPIPPSTTSLKVLALCSSLFLKLPISERLNSPDCVRVWRGEGSIAHRLTNPAVRIRGSTSAEPLPGSPSLVYFSQLFFYFFAFTGLLVFSQSCVASSFFPASPRSPTHSFFLYIFSKPNLKLL